MAATVASRILGYARDIILVAQFGQGALTDAYYAAFTIPDFLYTLVVGGALGPVFIPVFAGYLAKDKAEDGWIVAGTVINLVLILMGGGILLGWIFTPTLVSFLVPGFSAEMADLTVTMTRIMFMQALLMALSGLAMGILNGHNHFLASSLGSVVYNLGIVVLGVTLAPHFGIIGFAFAVVGGSAFYLLVQVPSLYRLGWRYRKILDLNHPGVRQIGRMLLPILLGLSVNQLNFLVNQNLASTLDTGILTALRMAQRLMQLPISLFAITIAISLFPTMTKQAAKGDDAGYKDTFTAGLRNIWFLSLPAAIGLAVLREPLIGLLYGQGAFDPEAVILTADLLLYYCLGLFAYASLHLLNRAFYGLQDTKTPMIIACITVVVNIILSILFRFLWEGQGLAIAYSVSGMVNMLLLLLALRKHIGAFGGRKLLSDFLRTSLAAVLMGVGVYLVLAVATLIGPDATNKLGQLYLTIIGVLSGSLFYFCLARGLGIEELQWFLAKYGKKRK